MIPFRTQLLVTGPSCFLGKTSDCQTISYNVSGKEPVGISLNQCKTEKLGSLCKTPIKNRKQLLKLCLHPIIFHFQEKAIPSPLRKIRWRTTAASELPKYVNLLLAAGYPTRGGKLVTRKSQDNRTQEISRQSPFHLLSWPRKQINKQEIPNKKVSGIIGCWKANFLHEQNARLLQHLKYCNEQSKDGPIYSHLGNFCYVHSLPQICKRQS